MASLDDLPMIGPLTRAVGRRDSIEEEERFVPSKDRAEIIHKVYKVDPLLCPACRGQMSIIVFIEDHKVIDKIIAHLKLTFMAERPPPPQIAQQELLIISLLPISLCLTTKFLYDKSCKGCMRVEIGQK